MSSNMFQQLEHFGSLRKNVDDIALEKLEAISKYLEAFNAIGEPNAQTVSCGYLGTHLPTTVLLYNQQVGYEFDDAVVCTAFFAIPLPPNKGLYTVVLNKVITELIDADASDFLNEIKLWGIPLVGTITLIDTDSTNHGASGPETVESTQFANDDVSSYIGLVLEFATNNMTTPSDFNMQVPVVEYYYKLR